MNVNGKVVILLFESLKNKDVRTFLQQTLTKDCYKSIEPPESLKNNYYLEKNFAFFIALDAIVKFEQVINDNNLIDEYIEQLKRIFKKLRLRFLTLEQMLSLLAMEKTPRAQMQL